MEIASIVMEFSKDIMSLVRMVMESNVGINKKTNTNTLINSNIYNTLSVHATNDGDLVFDILLNDYIAYIESGRRKGAKMPPVEPIVMWAKKHGIPSDNSTIFLIRRAISRDGIKLVTNLNGGSTRSFICLNDNIANKLFDKITLELDKFFNE